MPDKPMWYGRLDKIIAELNALPYPFVDRSTLERVMRVGRRRAQQILQPCVSLQVGANGLADRDELVAHLQRMLSGDAVHYESQRQQRFAESVSTWRQQAERQPRVLVEAPSSVANSEFQDLPDGIELGAGKLTVHFADGQQALEKLLALAMAIGNDFDKFERLTSLK